jgi:hypothetical protein
MSTATEEFASRFDAALKVKPTDKTRAAASYDRLNQFVRQLKTLEDVDSCLKRYLAIYGRHPKDDPRSEMIFAMLAERRIKMTGPDDDFVDRLYEEVVAGKRPLSTIAARVNELETNRRNGIVRELKEARRRRQTSGSILDTLRQMYRKTNERPAQSVEELYQFDPFPDKQLHTQYRQVVAALEAAWRQAEQQLTARSYAYNPATTATELVRLQNTGYNGFKLRFEAFASFLHQKRNDDRALFQLLKWSRDVVRPVKAASGGKTFSKGAAVHLEEEVYVHIIFEIYLNAVGEKHLVRRPEGFTTAEKAFFLDPLKPAQYYSNFLNRFKLVFPGGDQPSNVEAFTKLATLYSQLILFARSQRLALVNDDLALKIEAKLQDTPGYELATRRFSTKGSSNWAYAQDTFAIGDLIGTDIRVAYFEGSRPTSIYLELATAPGFLFEATLSRFTRKVETGLYQLLWLYNKGLIPLLQKFFEIIGYLPVLIEAGFVGVAKQVIQDQIAGAALKDASEGFGVDLSALGMLLPLLPTHKLPGGKAPALQEPPTSTGLPQKTLTSGDATASKALSTLAGDDAKALSRLSPGDARATKAIEASLAKNDPRMAKVIEQQLAKDEHRMAQARAVEAPAAQQAEPRAIAQGEGRTAQAQAGDRLTTGGGSTTEPRSSQTKTTEPQPRRRVVTTERRPPDPAKPLGTAADAGTGAGPKIAKKGKTVEQEELRKHVLARLAEGIQGRKGDPTEFLGVHEAVTIGTKKFGGKSTFSGIAKKLQEASALRVKGRKKELTIRKEVTEEAPINFISRPANADLKADYERLTRLTKGTRVPEFEHLSLTPKTIGDIREELAALTARPKIGALRTDVTEAWFRKKEVQIADISLRENDPMHLFKTKMYKRVMETMLPGFKVFAYDIKPMPNGRYVLNPVK